MKMASPAVSAASTLLPSASTTQSVHPAKSSPTRSFVPVVRKSRLRGPGLFVAESVTVTVPQPSFGQSRIPRALQRSRTRRGAHEFQRRDRPTIVLGTTRVPIQERVANLRQATA